jgi:hypothetical protein
VSGIRRYDLHGRLLDVAAPTEDLHRSIATVLAHRGIAQAASCPPEGDATRTVSSPAGSTESPWRLSIEHASGVSLSVSEFELVGCSDRTGIAIYRGDDRLVFSVEGAAATVRLSEGRARICVDPAFAVEESRGPTLRFTHLVGLAVVGLAQAAGWVSLHAAVLVRNGRGVMLLAESDAGKSTTAFQLVRQGWQFVSDDSVLLRETNRGIEARSMRPHFCLDAGSERHFPELSGQDWPEMVRDEVKWRVDVERLYPGRFLPSCQPRAVVMPVISGEAESRLTPVAAHTLLPTLLRQSGFRLTAGSKRADRHFQLIGALLRQCAAYRFCGGRDVLEDGRRVHRLFADRIATENPNPPLRRRRTD